MKETYTNWLEYEPAQIRDALPMEWVIGRLFDDWGACADMQACPLPDHDDSTPSFNLWSVRNGVFVRFGCFGCGRRGDAVDAIRLAYGVGFLEACRIAVEELLPEYAAGDFIAQRSEAVEASPDALRGVLDRVSSVNIEVLKAFIDSRALPLAAEFAQYAVGEWRWRAQAIPPIVYFPHFDPSGHTTAIKLRDVRTGRRWNVVGSRFPYLYGQWRDRGSSRVLLCEGETDTVWAAWALRNVEDIDVLGLPSGAAQVPTSLMLTYLRERLVTLAFDGDDAGRIATENWTAALSVVGVLEVPEGLDLVEWKPDLEAHYL